MRRSNQPLPLFVAVAFEVASLNRLRTYNSCGQRLG
jgi:hypothetical protein